MDKNHFPYQEWAVRADVFGFEIVFNGRPRIWHNEKQMRQAPYKDCPEV